MMETATLYPVMLNLRGRRVVIVGGGAVAAQKLRELIDAGARVRVVSPELSTALETIALDAGAEVVRREYREGDLEGAFLAIAATNDTIVNQRIWQEAEARGVLLNAVDDVERCHFIAPSVHRAGDITVTVSTAGRCPALAVRLRERFAREVGREHAEFARLAGSLRAEIARRVPSFDRRKALWYAIVDSSAIEELREGRSDAARETIERLIRASETQTSTVEGKPTGRVALVGAGPGDPSLITVRGRELLARADVVVHDGLIDSATLALASPSARLLHVGKHGHGASTSQEEINRVLVREARAGRVVVRLKGGDPYVFGRGAEEGEHLRRAGVTFEVVPGVSSAIAAPSAAGIPLTHRELASGFAVVTGHQCARDEQGSSTLDWSALARIPTLVVLMGLRALPVVVERLVQQGRSPSTPAAAISNATLPTQRVVVGTLATIAARVSEAKLPQPATIVIGDVVGLHRVLGPQAGVEGRSGQLPKVRRQTRRTGGAMIALT